jgi:hypothetical protein
MQSDVVGDILARGFGFVSGPHRLYTRDISHQQASLSTVNIEPREKKRSA